MAARLLDRFEEVGLVDDARVRPAWVERPPAGQGLAPRALAQELRRKGVDDEVAREALDEIDPDEQEEAARALVRKKLRSLCAVSTTHRPPGGWSACWPARATRRAWRSRWCKEELGAERGRRVRTTEPSLASRG